MDCSAFRRHHVAYVDDTLPGDLVAAAARHVAECPACARHDTAVRRSLLLARNLSRHAPPLECSADFGARLEARLRVVREERLGGAPVADDWAPSWWELASARLRSRPAAAAAAALVALTAGASLRTTDNQTMQQPGAVPTAVVPFGSPFSPPAVPVALAVEEPMFLPDGGGHLGTWVMYEDERGAVDPGTLDPGALVAPVATGVPVWAAAMLAGEAPVTLWRGTGRTRATVRGGTGAPVAQLISDETR